MELKEENIKEYLQSLSKGTLDDESAILNLCEMIKNLNLESEISQKNAFEDLFELISLRLKYNKDFALKMINFHPSFIKFSSDELINDKDIFLECVKYGGHIENYIGYTFHKWLKDRSILLECIKYKPYYIQYAEKKDIEDLYFIKNCICSYPKIIRFLPYELQIKEELLDIVLSQNETVNFSFVCEDYPFREKVINSLISRRIENLTEIKLSKEEIDKYLIKEIYSNELTTYFINCAEERESRIKEFIKKINELTKELSDYLIEEYSKNYNIMQHLLSVRGLGYFHFVSDNLLYNVNFIRDCIKIADVSDLTIINNFKPKILLNRKVIFELIKKGYSLAEFLEEQLSRKDVVHYAKENSLDLSLLKSNLLEDMDLILFEFNKEDNICAIFKIYDNLSASLKKEKRVVIKVLRKMDKETCIENENFIVGLDSNLKNDKDVAEEIISISPYYLVYLSKEVRDNKDIIDKACNINKDAIKQATIKRQFLHLFGL